MGPKTEDGTRGGGLAVAHHRDGNSVTLGLLVWLGVQATGGSCLRNKETVLFVHSNHGNQSLWYYSLLTKIPNPISLVPRLDHH